MQQGFAPQPTVLQPEPRCRPRRDDSVRYQLKVPLDDSHPPIWRRLDVRSDLMLDTFYLVLQAAFAWFDGHLHRFASGGSAFDPPRRALLVPMGSR